jgi:hypothetical protein
MTRAAGGRAKGVAVGAEFEELEKAMQMSNIMIYFRLIYKYLIFSSPSDLHVLGSPRNKCSIAFLTDVFPCTKKCLKL